MFGTFEFGDFKGLIIVDLRASPKRSSQETDWIPASEKVENEIIKMDSDGETTMVGGINAVHRG